MCRGLKGWRPCWCLAWGRGWRMSRRPVGWHCRLLRRLLAWCLRCSRGFRLRVMIIADGNVIVMPSLCNRRMCRCLVMHVDADRRRLLSLYCRDFLHVDMDGTIIPGWFFSFTCSCHIRRVARRACRGLISWCLRRELRWRIARRVGRRGVRRCICGGLRVSWQFGRYVRWHASRCLRWWPGWYICRGLRCRRRLWSR